MARILTKSTGIRSTTSYNVQGVNVTRYKEDRYGNKVKGTKRTGTVTR
jgi:hypothetical protein